MKIIINVSAIKLVNNTFIPQFHLIEDEGGHATDINYLPIEKDVCSSEEEALEHAKVHALREVKEKYASDIELRFN